MVLLDDPLAAVDVPTARHLMDHVLGGILKGRTVILVTHNKSALELCDKVFLMQNGELKEVGLEEEAIQEMFLAADAEQESDEKISGTQDLLSVFVVRTVLNQQERIQEKNVYESQ